MKKYLLSTFVLLLATSAQAAVDDLINAVKNNDLNAVQNLLNNGENVNAVNDQGNSALHYAVAMDNADITKLLLRSGANINIENSKGWSPIKIAEKKNVQNVTAVLAEELQKEHEEAQKMAIEQAQKIKQQVENVRPQAVANAAAAVSQKENKPAEPAVTPQEQPKKEVVAAASENAESLNKAVQEAEDAVKNAENARLEAQKKVKELQEKLQKLEPQQTPKVAAPQKENKPAAPQAKKVQPVASKVVVKKTVVKVAPKPQPKKVVLQNSNLVQGIYAGDEEVVYCLNLLGQGESMHMLGAASYYAMQSGMTEARYNQIKDLSNQFFATAPQDALRARVDACAKVITPADQNKQNRIIRSLNYGLGVK